MSCQRLGLVSCPVNITGKRNNVGESEMTFNKTQTAYKHVITTYFYE